MHVIEANDRGKYALLYEDIWSLLGQVAGDEQESEIVKLELLGFSQNAMKVAMNQDVKDPYESLISVLDGPRYAAVEQAIVELVA